MNQNDNCPIATTLDVIGGKWKIHILCVLADGKMRTNEIKREIPNIAQKVL
ncbi:winged helix-turn-helix transcriptional regulator, partial [Bacillus mycoides]